LARRLEKGLAAKVGQPTVTPKKSNAENMAWQAAGLHCSANERRADEASRDVEAWLKCKYMREHLGEEYGGVVTSATSFGIFVTLDAMYVEGLVHITELGGEYFRFDEARQELRGERTGTRYAIGTRVRIQVSRVDLDGRKIDFRLVNETEGLVGKVTAEKASSRDVKARASEGGRFGSEPPARLGSAVKSDGRKRKSKNSASASRALEKAQAPSKKANKKRR
jgi:ribonuclease R